MQRVVLQLLQAQALYHNFPCNRVEDVRSGYLQWCNERRQAMLQHLQTMDVRFKTELKCRDQKVQEELERLQQLRGVMCCPHCNHPCGEVGDLRCGKFICGRLETDSAASAVAGGCGREFRSSDALPFRAELPAALQQPLCNNIAKWTLRDGQPLRCKCCRNQVEGPLLQCVGCNGLNVCIHCEAKGHEHVRNSSEQPCHNDSHYFFIHTNPESNLEFVQHHETPAATPSAAASTHHQSHAMRSTFSLFESEQPTLHPTLSRSPTLSLEQVNLLHEGSAVSIGSRVARNSNLMWQRLRRFYRAHRKPINASICALVLSGIILAAVYGSQKQASSICGASSGECDVNARAAPTTSVFAIQVTLVTA
jgi:hypothetical protein